MVLAHLGSRIRSFAGRVGFIPGVVDTLHGSDEGTRRLSPCLYQPVHLYLAASFADRAGLLLP